MKPGIGNRFFKNRLGTQVLSLHDANQYKETIIFATNFSPIYLQPDGLNMWLFDLTKFKVWTI